MILLVVDVTVVLELYIKDVRNPNISPSEAITNARYRWKTYDDIGDAML